MAATGTIGLSATASRGVGGIFVGIGMINGGDDSSDGDNRGTCGSISGGSGGSSGIGCGGDGGKICGNDCNVRLV